MYEKYGFDWIMNELDWNQKYREIWDHLRWLSPNEPEVDMEHRMYDRFSYPIVERNYCYIFYFYNINQEILQEVSSKFNVSYTIMVKHSKVMIIFTEQIRKETEQNRKAQKETEAKTQKNTKK